MVVILFLLGSHPAWTRECFDFEDIFSTGGTQTDAKEKVSRFQALVTKFFYLKGEWNGENISRMTWSTARELAHFLEQEGFVVRVREDFYNAEKESFFVMVTGSALIGGYVVGAYIEPYTEKLFTKFHLSKNVMLALTLLWRTGFMVAAWFGGKNIFETNCDFLFSGTLSNDSFPVMKRDAVSPNLIDEGTTFP